ncbi:MAG: hypothetical protein OXB84_05985, partial [Halobacteriovoraceae bacterium]|nr:hypothetical protein [Halobacteriovoraceae bacterium]
MSLPAFIKNQNQQNDQQEQNQKKNKRKNFNERCQFILEKIKRLDEEKHEELNRTYQSEYCGHNVQKKRIIGFYGQLVHEFKILQDKADKGDLPPKISAPVENKNNAKPRENKKEMKPAA